MKKLELGKVANIKYAPKKVTIYPPLWTKEFHPLRKHDHIPKKLRKDRRSARNLIENTLFLVIQIDGLNYFWIVSGVEVFELIAYWGPDLFDGLTLKCIPISKPKDSALVINNQRCGLVGSFIN